MWWNLDDARYEIPKDGNKHSMFAGALWIGGVDAGGQLKVAAMTYRQGGNDFWPGPLTNTGEAEVDAETCQEYDHFTISYRSDAKRHRQFHDAEANGTVEEEFPDGYATPTYFFDYPAHGNVAKGQHYYLAPFLDYNEDG